MSRVEHIGDATLRGTTIYALCEEDGTPRYVGKTVQYAYERHKAHISQARRAPRLPVHRWMRKRIEQNSPLVIHVLEFVPPGADWVARERYWIGHYRDCGHALLNITDGGEGLPGHVFSKEHREKIAAAIRTGATFACETCGTPFWRKQKDIRRRHNRFCSRSCYATSLRGVSRPMPALAVARGVASAAAVRRARTHCKRGHPLSGDNLFNTSSGSRGCKACRRLHTTAYRERARG